MKKLTGLVFVAAFLLIITSAAFATDGVSGWVWQKVTDSMTDQSIFVFLQFPETGAAHLGFGLRYSPTDNHWVWGFLGMEPGNARTVELTYRFGKDPAETHSFVTDGLWVELNVDNLGDFVKKSTILVRVAPGEEYRFSLVGLAKTIQMAGLSLDYKRAAN